VISTKYNQIHDNVKTLESDRKLLSDQVADLKTTIVDKRVLDQKLTQIIDTKRKKIADLDVLESKRDKIALEAVDLDSEYQAKKKHLWLLGAFEGFIQSTSLEKQELFIATLPDLLNEVKQGKCSPELIHAFILEKLTGGNLKVLKCGACDAKFYVNKIPSVNIGYYCPACGTSYGITVDKDESDILKSTLARITPKATEIRRTRLS
jgi:hypothetical protein